MNPSHSRALIESALGGTPYLPRMLELLAEAEHGQSNESCVVLLEHQGMVHAIALVGLVAGAVGAGKIHLIAGSDRRIVARACDVLRALGARFAIAEWPEDAPFRAAEAMLRDEGFVEEARIAAFYAATVPLVFLRRDF